MLHLKYTINKLHILGLSYIKKHVFFFLQYLDFNKYKYVYFNVNN